MLMGRPLVGLHIERDERERLAEGGVVDQLAERGLVRQQRRLSPAHEAVEREGLHGRLCVAEERGALVVPPLRLVQARGRLPCAEEAQPRQQLLARRLAAAAARIPLLLLLGTVARQPRPLAQLPRLHRRALCCRALRLRRAVATAAVAVATVHALLAARRLAAAAIALAALRVDLAPQRRELCRVALCLTQQRRVRRRAEQ